MRSIAPFLARTLLLIPFLAAAVTLADDKPAPETESDAEDIVSPGPTSLPELKNIPATEALIATTTGKPLFIFKHSTQCPVSAAASDRLTAYVKEVGEKLGEDTPRFVWVKVIESRPVSNFLEKRFEVKHESPQVLLVRDGKVVWHTSHEKITAEAMATALKSANDKPLTDEQR